MIAEVVGRLGELVDRKIRRGEVGVAEAEIDDVRPASTPLDLQAVDDREDVGRQRGDPSELHDQEP
jgi:hypothetical protein